MSMQSVFNWDMRIFGMNMRLVLVGVLLGIGSFFLRRGGGKRS